MTCFSTSWFRPSLVVLIVVGLSLLLGSNAQTPTPQPTKTLSMTSINYGKGIACDAPLTLNMGGRAYPRLVPIGKTCYLQMTTDDEVSRASTAVTQFRFRQNNFYDFTVRFKYRMFGPAQGIGDGLAYLLHHDPRGDTARGDLGGNLGVYGATPIRNAVVIEFDSYQNGGSLGDEAQFAIHVRTVNATGFVQNIVQVPAPVRSTAMNDFKVAIISYQNGRLTVTLDGVLRINLRTTLNNVLTRQEVFAGFAAATSAQADLHDIYEWTMQQGPPTAMPSAAPSEQPTTVRQRNFFARIIDVIRIIIATFGRMQGGTQG